MSEIAWRAWSDEAFAEARAQDKPVLLSITASWCQFCRAMDEQTYGNEALAQYINGNVIPVRVDSDLRPDVNARYTQGGWPTTCVLTSDGDMLWGGTSVPADGMAQLLPQVLNEYKNNKPGIAQHIQNVREQIRQQNTSPALDRNRQIDPNVSGGVLLSAKFEFDFAFGGFGHNGQKFPHVDVVEFVMEQYARSEQYGVADADLRLMLERTFEGMGSGGMHDAVDGGFFRYAQTPDWNNPQVEKLLEDNATIARVLCRASQLLESDSVRALAEKTLGYMRKHLFDDVRGAFGGSQFADAQYYSQPAAERSSWNVPTVDPTVLTGPNAQAVRALVAWWQATGDAESLTTARRVADFLIENALQADGALLRFVSDNAQTEVSAGGVPTGLLADAADAAAAFLDLYEAGQGVSYLDKAEEIANWVRGHLEDPVGGGLFDQVVRPDALGNLKVGTRDVTDNMQMTDALFRLFLGTGEQDHFQLGHRILQAFQPAVPQMGFFGATVALAIERASLPPVLVYVLGATSDPKTAELLAAAHRPYRFERFVQPLDPSDPDDAEHIENLEFALPDVPTAHIQIAATPLAPTIDPETLSETIKNATMVPTLFGEGDDGESDEE